MGYYLLTGVVVCVLVFLLGMIIGFIEDKNRDNIKNPIIPIVFEEEKNGVLLDTIIPILFAIAFWPATIIVVIRLIYVKKKGE